MERRHENVVTAFAHTDHQVISFVENQPQVFATRLDIDSSETTARESGMEEQELADLIASFERGIHPR